MLAVTSMTSAKILPRERETRLRPLGREKQFKPHPYAPSIRWLRKTVVSLSGARG
jgi:hypothetical protein